MCTRTSLPIAASPYLSGLWSECAKSLNIEKITSITLLLQHTIPSPDTCWQGKTPTKTESWGVFIPFIDQVSPLFALESNARQGGVIWPVLLLYPQYGQSDLIQTFGDHDMVAEHLAVAFPEEGPPAQWDEAFEYR